MEIVSGAACDQSQLRAVALSLIDTFGYAYPEWRVSDAIEELRNQPGLPASFVAVEDGQPVGCASLLADDEVSGYEHVSTWLGNLWVHPDFRGRGIGTALIESVMQEARQQDALSVHLITDSAFAWYVSMGWNEVGSALVHSHPFSVMRLELEAQEEL